jgi:hypothetical protein
LIFAAALASRFSRSRSSGLPAIAAGSDFSATLRCSRSVARYTTPMPPRPTARTIS